VANTEQAMTECGLPAFALHEQVVICVPKQGWRVMQGHVH
jgi:hypothetical protein